MKIKRFLNLALLFSWSTVIMAQDYFIDFAGYGASSKVTSVKIDNLTQGKSITISGDKTLHLASTIIGIGKIDQGQTGKLKLFPNPMIDYINVQFDLAKGGKTLIEIYDSFGRLIGQKHDFLPIGQHTYKIQNLNKGIYIVRINSNKHSFSGRIISINNTSGGSIINYEYSSIYQALDENNSLKSETNNTKSESANDTIMQYNAGDILIMKGTSDSYSSLVPDVPFYSKTISFEFIPCVDPDNNNYTVVGVGNQVWMAENLRTTKYNDSTTIPLVEEANEWQLLYTPSYCWYNNDTLIEQSYGALYNWYTVDSASNGDKNICPTGWHVPTKDEWISMVQYLGGENIAGGKLKEEGTSHWRSENVWVPGTNESGFTALPGGKRDYDGNFESFEYWGNWWCSTEYNVDNGIGFSMGCSNSAVQKNTYSSKKPSGYSIRCVRDTDNQLPVITTSDISSITSSTATCGGTITLDGGSPVTVRGVCWDSKPNPTIDDNKTNDGSGVGSFSSSITGLILGETYYIRAYAENANGISYGNQNSFITTNLATLYTLEPYSITTNSAISGGSISFDGGETIFERGVCWSTTPDPTILDNKFSSGEGLGDFICNLSELYADSIYYIRAYAINNGGTSYGNTINFKTYSGTMTDVEGNIYFTINIGNQQWMAENLKVTMYSDETPISLANSSILWDSLTDTSKAYCWYNDSISNKDIYGAIYNWAGAMNGAESSIANPSGVQGVCPDGWHLPSDEEWKQLVINLNDNMVSVGGKLKQKGFSFWRFPNTNATNESGFTALPGGTREYSRQCYGVEQNGYWWSATEGEYRYLGFDTARFNSSYDAGPDGFTESGLAKKHGFSVRCIKD